MLNISNKKVIVIGGGKVAFRKTKKFLEYDCKVTVISERFIEEFEDIKEHIEMIYRNYSDIFIKDAFFVVAATSSKEVNKRVANDCNENNILCNVVDDIEKCDFIVPSSIKRGSLVLSVSTLGKSPSLVSSIRKELEEKYTEEYKAYVDILGDIRMLVLEKCSDIKKRKKILKEIINLNLEDLKRRKEKYENSRRI